LLNDPLLTVAIGDTPLFHFRTKGLHPFCLLFNAKTIFFGIEVSRSCVFQVELSDTRYFPGRLLLTEIWNSIFVDPMKNLLRRNAGTGIKSE
jgi:hypothetical protein